MNKSESTPPPNYGTISTPSSNLVQVDNETPQVDNQNGQGQAENQPDFSRQEGYQAGYQPLQGENSERRSAPAQPAPYASRSYGWFEDLRRNKAQSNSLAAAWLICSSGGMSLAWSVGFGPLIIYAAMGVDTTHIQICWFIGVMIGASSSTVVIQHIPKRIFNIVSSVLVIVNGILFVSAPENVTAVIVARYFDGIAFGLSVVPAIIAGSEQAAKRFRGLVLTAEQGGLTAGFLVTTIYAYQNSGLADANRVHGSLAITYGIIALIFSFVLTHESPLFYLNIGDESKATIALCRLQRPQTMSREVQDQLEEEKHLLAEDQDRGLLANLKTAIMPMLNLGVFRALISMSFSLPLTLAFLMASVANDKSFDFSHAYSYGLMRFLGSIFAMYSIDGLGRKYLNASLIIGGGLLLGVGKVFSSDLNLFDSSEMQTAVSLLMAYQVFAGYAAPVGTCYLGEAFSFSVKPYCILLSILIENGIQILVCCCYAGTPASTSAYGYALGSLQMALGIYFLFALPETKQTTLREALAKFKRERSTVAV